MQKFCPQEHTKTDANTLVMPSQKSLHILPINVPSGALGEVVAGFRSHLVEDGKSPKTVESYVGDGLPGCEGG